jgi:hypothetical protein
MFIKPSFEDFIQNDENIESSKEINFEAAAAAALSNNSPSVPPQKNGNGFVEVLDNQGASLEAAARRIATTLNFPDKQELGLKAAEMILRANGLLRDKEKDKKDLPEVNITIVGTSNQTLINVLMPK